jgi:isochorismate synthase
VSAEPPALRVAWRPLGRDEAALDPLALFAAAPGEERFYLEQPARGTALAALGAVAEVAAGGERRFALAAEAARALAARTRVCGERPPQAPLLVGGFAFRPGDARPGSPWRRLGDLRFALPRLLWWREGERAWLAHAIRAEDGAPVEERLAASAAEADALLARARCTAPAAAGAARPRLLRPRRGYRARVAGALDAIAKGELDKVVIARALALDGVAAPLERWLAALRSSQPACAIYAVARTGPPLAFLGATPELLVRARGRTLAAQALAGTAAAGREGALLASEKERAEHACVVQDVAAALAPICEGVEHPAAPRALALGGLVHLETPVRARLAEGSGLGLLDVAGRLHPSPAVCGAPRAAASRWLDAHEGLERGWYAGGIGWLDAAGGGELFVALRCALLAGRRAELFAGAGIVAGSTPAAEQRETRMKLRALLRVAAEA